MRRISFVLLTLIGFFNGPLGAQSPDVFKAQFKSPPKKAYPKTYWWWLNGHVDTVRIREEIFAMHEAGLSGFDIFDIGVPASDTVVKDGAPFLGQESLQAIELALRLAKSLDMTAGLSMASSWNAGGAWIKPQHAAKSIYFSVTEWTGKKGARLSFPLIDKTDERGRSKWIEFTADGRPVYYEDVAILAIPDRKEISNLTPSDILNVTDYFDPASETLDWDHRGAYKIYRYVCSNSGEQLKLPSKLSAGPIIDHFDAEATAAHFNYVLDKLRTILPQGIEHSALKSLYLASYEATGFTWTPTLPEVFEKINGYEIYPFIPSLFDEGIFDPELVGSFQRDFRRTLSELMIDNFYRVAKRISNANGLMINSESGGPGFPLHNVPVEPLKSLGVMDLPRGEFWINHNRLNAEGIDILRVVKEVSAASHIYARGMVEEEAFTTFQHWQEGPFEMKPAGDRAFCEGMNKVVVHGSSHNPRGYGLPGIYYGAGTHFNDRRIWWPKVKPFTDYLARISLIGQSGNFVSDVLYYYGDAIPNYAGHKNGRFTVGPGFDYEVINTEILNQLRVKDGQLELPSGARFKLLVLEDEKIMHPEVFQKLRELLKGGAIVLGDKPDSIAHRLNLPQRSYSREDIESLWSEKYPLNDEGITGKVISGISPLELIQQMEITPDFTYADADLFLMDFIHYKMEDRHFYFIRNATDQWLTRKCLFRQNGSYAEIWNPVDGSAEPALLGKQKESGFEIPLSLPPFGSLFVVFSQSAGPNRENPMIISEGDLSLPQFSVSGGDLILWEDGRFHFSMGEQDKFFDNYIKKETLTGAWEVFFPPGWDAPERAIFPQL
ncbi:MAG: hypothetical protein KDC80_27275, partial [Saprospiraceae bacterium]|nr:hypothetical protein [Saprospiraceae bacterium]